MHNYVEGTAETRQRGMKGSAGSENTSKTSHLIRMQSSPINLNLN